MAIRVPFHFNALNIADMEQLQYAADCCISNGSRTEVCVQTLRRNGGELLLPNGRLLKESELKGVFDALTLRLERASGRLDGLGRFDENALAWNVSTPWVDLVGKKTETVTLLRHNIPQTVARAFRVCIAHDVDHTITFEATAFVNAILKTIGCRQAPCFGWGDILRGKSLLKNFERLLEVEIQEGIGAHYFMMAGPYGWRRYSSRTDIRWRSSVEIARLIRSAGMRIGLHGSFYAREQNSYRDEKDRLEQTIGCAVKAHRNHYLRFDPIRMYSQLEEAGLSLDMSVGFVSRIGFRAGTARCRRAFDLFNNRPSRVFSVPQIFMDSVLERASYKLEEILSDLRTTLTMAKAVNGCVCLVFHPEMFLMDQREWPLFEKVVTICKELGADLSGAFEGPDFGSETAETDSYVGL